MVTTALAVHRLTARRSLRLSHILSAIAAELVMILGYFTYEFLILGLCLGIEGYGISAILNIPFNAVQGLVGILLAVFLYEILSRAGISPEKGFHT